MIVSRRVMVGLNWFLDSFVPPILRDSFVFSLVSQLITKGAPMSFRKFRSEAFEMTDQQFRDFYEKTALRVHQGATDLSPKSAEAVRRAVTAGPVLEAGCGRGWLAKEISKSHRVVATDVSLTGSYAEIGENMPSLVECNLEALPFSDGQFPTVVCTHTLEHVLDFQKAIGELRRVCSGTLVVVVPRQRPYDVTFSPHLHFFPYRWSLLAYTGVAYLHSLTLVGGDWLLIEHHHGESPQSPDAPTVRDSATDD